MALSVLPDWSTRLVPRIADVMTGFAQTLWSSQHPHFIAVADARERVTAELPGLLVRGDEKDGLFDAVKP